jgi:hypothetical protein
MAIVRVNSHRAREKMERLLGFEPTEYFSFSHDYHWWEVPDDKLEEILKIKGIRKSKLPENARECINWSK